MKKKQNVCWLLAGIAAAACSLLGGCSHLGKPYETVSLSAAAPEAGAEREADGLPDGREQTERKTETEFGEDSAANGMLVLDLALEDTGERSEKETQERREAEAETDTVSFLFAGDIYLSEFVLNAYDKAGGIGGVLEEGLRAEIEKADLFVANQEFPFSDRGTPAPDKQFTFRLPTNRAHLMQELGVDLVTLANNHALDYGTDALLDTCAVLEDLEIPYLGAGANLEAAAQAEFVELNGKTYGFLAASRVFPVAGWAAGANHAGMLSAYDPAAVCEVIRKVKQSCDYLVFYVHWGIERNPRPEGYQREQGHQYIDAGADLVIGSHPHVLQGVEYYQGKPIFYSLGNFIFGSSIPETMLVKAEISAEGETALSVIPATSALGYTRALEEEKRPAFYEKLTGLSEGIVITQEGQIQEAGAVLP